MKTISKNKSFGGIQGFYEHESSVCSCPMRFSVYEPPLSLGSTNPVLFWLSGLTCTEENFTLKSGFQSVAAELGLIIVAADTSPRGKQVPDSSDEYDFGQGAGFYLDATEKPWSEHYQMHRYISEELPELIVEKFPVNSNAMGIFGHSMGGHGALTMHLKYPERFRSVSAFSPIVAPTQVAWGEKAFSRYLGERRDTWSSYDATELVTKNPSSANILIDQGDDDEFLADYLKPELFKQACSDSGQQLNLRMQPGYDHSYYFIASFIDDHLQHHWDILNAD